LVVKLQQVAKDVKQIARTNLLNIPSMSEAADYVGSISVAKQEKHTGGGSSYEASFIIGGQILGSSPKAYLIYPQGNHITTSVDTPYLQIGESKYGKPILDRILRAEINLETAVLCGLVSMDSTMRSNLSVGPPIEVTVYETNSLAINRHYRFDEDSEYLRELKKSWDQNLKDAFNRLPPIAWSANWDRKAEEQGQL